MIPTDKLAHFCLGILIAGAFLMLAGPLAAALATVVAAVGKELYDLATHGKPDWLDATATLAGGAVVVGGALWLL